MLKSVFAESALALISVCAFPTNAQTLIDQATVIAAGGFPYTIASSGSYKLSGNLSTTATSAIMISADYVTLDLNGFTILCNSCKVNSFTLNGVMSTGHSTTIVNGKIVGFQGHGILFNNDQGNVDRLELTGNDVGIQQYGSNLTVTHTTVTGNIDTAQGIVSGLSGALLIADCRVSGNGGDGISVASSGLVTATAVVGNQGGGIVLGSGPQGPLNITVNVTNNVLTGNGNFDLWVDGGHVGYGLNTLTSVSGGVSMKNNVCSSGPC